MTNLEVQEPDSDAADDIRARLEELGALRAKKQRALEDAEKERAQVPDPESAAALVASLPLLEVDWELVSDNEFRDLLAALNFEASYDPTKRELTIRVTLVPELTHPDGPARSPFVRAPNRSLFELARPAVSRRRLVMAGSFEVPPFDWVLGGVSDVAAHPCGLSRAPNAKRRPEAASLEVVPRYLTATVPCIGCRKQKYLKGLLPLLLRNLTSNASIPAAGGVRSSAWDPRMPECSASSSPVRTLLPVPPQNWSETSVSSVLPSGQMGCPVPGSDSAGVSGPAPWSPSGSHMDSSNCRREKIDGSGIDTVWSSCTSESKRHLTTSPLWIDSLFG